MREGLESLERGSQSVARSQRIAAETGKVIIIVKWMTRLLQWVGVSHLLSTVGNVTRIGTVTASHFIISMKKSFL